MRDSLMCVFDFWNDQINSIQFDSTNSKSNLS